MASKKPLSIVSPNGTVDVQTELSGHYCHICGQRLQPLCRKLGTRFAPAVTGFQGAAKPGYGRRIDGVVVSVKSAPRLLAEIRARKKRNPAEQQRMRTATEIYQRSKEHYARYAVSTVPPLWMKDVDPKAVYPQECFTKLTSMLRTWIGFLKKESGSSMGSADLHLALTPGWSYQTGWSSMACSRRFIVSQTGRNAFLDKRGTSLRRQRRL